jgi:hypothetical protein
LFFWSKGGRMVNENKTDYEVLFRAHWVSVHFIFERSRKPETVIYIYTLLPPLTCNSWWFCFNW